MVEQLCAASGGPCTYSGRSMKATHEHMGVTAGEFDALIEDVVATLAAFKVGKFEQDEILGALVPLKRDIVEVPSSETGTPLPKSFVPAK